MAVSERWGLRLEGDQAVARLWAPSSSSVALLLADGRTVPMAQAGEGWHEARTTVLRAGDRYKFRVDGRTVPDPAALWQPDGLDGWSEIVELGEYAWQSTGWTGRPWIETVLYELHVGTFSQEGTFAGAVAHLDHLVRLGVTVIELMPVATFSGARNWGYDGVMLFAPDAAYGTPASLQHLVDECHRRGLSIVLDVVYNHFGPASIALEDYASAFFTERHHTPWGAAINFDGDQAAAVRAFYLQNALLWLKDYQFDGLRIDAVQAIKDDRPLHILTELSATVRAQLPGRQVHLMLENDLNEARWLGPEGGYEAQWNDDFHHVMRVLVADQTDGYYEDYAAEPIEYLGRALTEGFSYQGQESKHRPGMFRGTASGHLPPSAFVSFVQNHDQVGNAPYGKRLSALARAEAVRLGTAVMLLSPSIPMLFMGEEWAASTPFDYFCDYDEPLAGIVRSGRREEFKRFKEFQSEAALARLSDPTQPETMLHSKLDWDEVGTPGHAEVLDFHTRALSLRAKLLVPLLGSMTGGAAQFRTLSDRAILAQWPTPTACWSIAANFSPDPVQLGPIAGKMVFALGSDQPDELSGWGFRAWIGPAA